MKPVFMLIYTCLLAALMVAPALANPIIFAAHGTAGGAPANGSAGFSLGTSTLTVTMTNMAGPAQLSNISSVLDGLEFTLKGSVSGLMVHSADAPAKLNCISGSAACEEQPGGTVVSERPYEWGLSSRIEQGITIYQLFAGGSSLSLKPNGIVNMNIDGSKDGLSNGPHNPYLLGPVDFVLTYDASGPTPTGVESATLFFGTSYADHLPGVLEPPNGGGEVPEPAALALVGAGLLAIAHLGRRRLSR